MGIGSTLLEGVRVALDSLRSNKVRSALTILGVTIGVMVVMVMAAMVQGLNSSFQDAIASAGPNTFYVFHAPPGGGGVSGPLDGRADQRQRRRLSQELQHDVPAPRSNCLANPNFSGPAGDGQEHDVHDHDPSHHERNKRQSRKSSQQDPVDRLPQS